MTVYNRKMFRKKAGGATGIMASGPELMKRFRVGGVNVVGNPTQPGTKFRLNYPSQFSPQVPNTNFIPTGGGNLGTSILQSLMKPMMGPAAFYLDQEASDSEEELKAKIANRAARAKNQRGGNVLRNRIAARQGIDVMETAPDAFKIPGTSLTFGDAAFQFKQQNKPILDFLKGIPGLATKTRDELNEIAREMGYPGGEVDTKKLATVNRKSLLNNVNKTIDYFKDMSDKQLLDQKLKEELEIVDADTDFGDFDSRKESEKAKDTRGTVERENVNPFELNKKVAAIGKVSHDEKDLTEDKQSTEVVINNTKNKNTKKIDEAKKDGLNATVDNHSFSNKFLDANDKNLNTDNLSNVLGINLEGLSLTDRKALYSSILESTVGDKGSIKSDKDFNLIMTGLLIAAGDSPDALTNITRGLAQGFKMYGDALDDDRKEKRQIQLTATKLAIQAEESAKERVFKKEENRLNRVTSVINKMIDSAGKNNNKFGQTLTTTIAANPKDYMSEAEYANFIKSSDQEKVNTIQNKVMGIYNASPFKNQATNFDTQAIIRGVLTGKIPQNIQKETDTKEETKTETSDIKIKKIN
tara:strand:+ start:572 stop:2320 length:1749 start_codon:yes stop_codon:yes gene_type:complete